MANLYNVDFDKDLEVCYIGDPEYKLTIQFPLRTAKALKQVEADNIRRQDHKRQLPLEWLHDGHANYFGYIEGVLYVVLRKV